MIPSWWKRVARSDAPHREVSRTRSLRPLVEELEGRVLLDMNPAPGTYTPAQMRHAYGFDELRLPDGTIATGAGQTVDIFASGTLDAAALQTGLQSYSTTYGLPQTTIQFVGLYGGGVFNVAGGGQGEAQLDVDQVHSFAPLANMVMVLSPINCYTQYADFANYVSASGASVGSASYGGPEVPNEAQYDSGFDQPHSTVFFAASDTGATGSYAPMSPYVVAVGGTSLYLDPAGDYLGETAWSNSFPAVYTGSGGISQFEPQPAYQRGVVTQSTVYRTNPDIAFNAAGETSAAAGFGTSAATPIAAAMLALVDQGRAELGLAPLGALQTLTALYSAPAGDYHDITSGFNGQYEAQPGYDLTTGRGSPIVNLLAPFMAGWNAPLPSASAATYRVNADTTLQVSAANGLARFAQSNLPAAPGLTFSVVAGPQHGSLTLNPDGSFTYTPTPGFEGSDTFTYQAASYVGPSAAATVTLEVGPSLIAAGADAGGPPLVVVRDAITGATLATFLAFPAGFTGGARVAVGDVNGDGVADIVCAAGPGGGPQVTVFDGRTFLPIMSVFALPGGFTGGVNVAVGDVNGDGFADIICGAGAGGGPEVTVTSGKDGTLLESFFAFVPTFAGGVRVAAGDVNHDGRADIITAAGPGGGPQVTVFDGKTLAALSSFFASAASFTGGVFVAAGDVNGDGFADITCGADAGGGPQVTVYSGQGQAVLASFFALPQSFTGGVRVGYSSAYGADAKPAILAAAGVGGGPQVTAFDAATLVLLDSFFALPNGFTNGLFVAAS
jgi:hypothetical protein